MLPTSAWAAATRSPSQLYSPAKLPWSKDKSVAGSLGMLLGGWVLAAFILFIFVLAGVFPEPFSNYLLPITVIALAGALVESLPLKDVDNITVTLVAVLLGHLLF